tara:strand:- start:280 stop:627 length:348 start_codon:yes stop_codon:yes gene_type:complete
MNGIKQNKKKNGFEDWWKKVLETHDYEKNPDNPLHYYDYRAAYKEGHKIPSKKGDHWLSKFKHDLHETRFIPGKQAGYPEISWWDSKYERPSTESEVIRQARERQLFEETLKVKK